MNEQPPRSSVSTERSDGGRDAHRAPSGLAILIVFVLIGLACISGYFLLMKLIAMSREDDCLLAHRTDCAAIEVPMNR